MVNGMVLSQHTWTKAKCLVTIVTFFAENCHLRAKS
jgi:hypothetical protein